MFCPNCGHQPSAATPRFCSGCGMRLDGVVKLIEAGGTLELLAPNAASTNSLTLSPKRRGMRLGAKIMFVAFVMLPFAFGLSIAADSPGPLLIPLTTFFLGLARSLYARLFSEDVSPPSPPLKINPPTEQPITFTGRLTPPSAVDPTTKLLGRE